MSRFEEAKRLNRLEDVLAADGVQLKKTGRSLMARCPLPGHDDSTPSFSVLPEKQTFRCFGCGRSGSVIDYVALRDGVSAEEAVHRLLMRAKGHDQAERCAPLVHRGNGEAKASVFPPSPAAAALLRDVVAAYVQNLAASPAAQRYLAGRGLGPGVIERFQVGFSDGKLVQKLASDGVQETALREIGVLKDGGREHFAGMVVVPIPAVDGHGFVQAYGRRIVDREPKHLYLPTEHRGVLNAEAARVYADRLVLAEKVFDFLSLWQIDVPSCIPCFGASGFTRPMEALLKDAGVRRVAIAFDRDEPGHKGAFRVAERLRALGIEPLRLLWPEGIKDANQWLVTPLADGRKVAREDFEALLAAAEPMAGGVAVAVPALSPRLAASIPAAPATKPPDFEHLVSVNDEEAVFAFPDVLYTVTGVDRATRDSLRVVVRAEAAATGKTHTDRLDLYLSRSRRSFALALGARMDVPPARVGEDLDEILATLAALHRRRREEAAATPAVPPMSAEEEKAARELLQAPDMLERVRAAYDRLNYVGEGPAKTLAYLCATSRRLPEPISLIVRSSSAAGKSRLLEKTAALMPPEDVERVSRITQAALYYMGDAHHLEGKLLLIDERTGSVEADHALRSLQTEKRLDLLVPVKTPSGGFRTKKLTVYGPTAVMESTTDEVEIQNANRVFEAALDESPEQTRRVLDAQRARWAHANGNGRGNGVGAGDPAALVRLFQNAQRLLRPARVEIPYAGQIRFPAEWIRARRDHERFLGLVAASAFLHQERRERVDGDPPVVRATLDDYRVAYGLARALLASAWSELPASAARLLDVVRARVERLADEKRVGVAEIAFRRRDVREWTRWPDHQVKRAMRTIEDLEYIETARGASGKSHRYRLLAPPAAGGAFAELTSPEDLARALAGGANGAQRTCVKSGTA